MVFDEKVYRKEYYERNKEIRARYYKEWRTKNKAWVDNYLAENKEHIATKQHARNLKCHYGITVDDYNNMLAAQNGLCAICEQPEKSRRSNGTNTVRRLAVDHCHATGRVRGLLCHHCNAKLSILDNKDLLQRALAYLKED